MDLSALLALVPGAAPYVAGAIAVSSAVATMLPPPGKHGTPYATFYGVLNFIALNMGHAKNATAPDAK